MKQTYEAYCLQCCGGGKSLGAFTTSTAASRAAGSHNAAWGHATTILSAAR